MQHREEIVDRPEARRPTQLLRDILDTSEEFEQHVGRTLAVNPTDLEAMEHLIMHGPLPPTELSRRLNISTAAVTAVIDRLIGVGHVTREQHPTDRRSVVVVPNPRSVETAMATLMPMIMGIDRVLDEFDDSEKLVIERYLDRVVTVYREQLPDGDDEGEGDADDKSGASASDLADTAPGSRKRPANAGGGGEPDPTFTFLSGVDGHTAGDPVNDVVALADALQNRYADIQGGGSEKLGVAQLRSTKLTDFEHKVGSSLAPGAPIFADEGVDVITAGLTCVPRENLYDVGCTSSSERPFANSLPNKRAPRGGFSVYPSPTMADVTDRQDEIQGEGDPEDNGDGTGIWTRTNDGDLTAVKNACAVIPCGTPEDFDIWGVYRCITIRNLLQLTFPELVAAYLNKLGALWARLAERTLLDSMINSPWSVDITRDVTDNGLGATANLLDTLLQATAVYTEQERYGDGMRFGVWLHRWVAVLLIRDWLKAPRYNPSMSELVAARSEVNAAFARAGYNVHWVIDSATSWQDIDTQAPDAALEGLPTTVDMKIAPEGNFERLDLGTPSYHSVLKLLRITSREITLVFTFYPYE